MVFSIIGWQSLWPKIHPCFEACVVRFRLIAACCYGWGAGDADKRSLKRVLLSSLSKELAHPNDISGPTEEEKNQDKSDNIGKQVVFTRAICNLNENQGV